MFRRALTLAACCLISHAAFALPAIGEAAPEFKGTNALTGKPFALSDFKGKPVVLEWNNFECPFVKKHYSVGAMQKLQETATKDGEVIWITINSGAEGKEGFLKDATTAKDAVSAHNGHETVFVLDHDGSIGHLYGAKTTPHMFVIDKEGKTAYMGAIDNKPTADTADIATASH